MTAVLSRRDFLKLAGLMQLSLAAPRVATRLVQPGGLQNVIVVVFDAFTAYNISLYGYPRSTTPNLARLAKRAVVYHNHYAGSSFTTSGTASLLTGTLPWTNRALLKDGQVAEPFTARSLFTAFQDYYRLAYTHNDWAYTLLKQLKGPIDQLVPIEKLYLNFHDSFINTLFGNDDDIASVSWTRDVGVADAGYAYSLFISRLYAVLQARQDADLMHLFPRGIPSTEDVGSKFLLETAIDWIANLLQMVRQPFLGYFHFLPPHYPYHTSAEFVDAFRSDGYRAVPKPVDVFATERIVGSLATHRREYDEFILYVDREFSRFYEMLQRAGILDNTWLIVTSDHGELFERGIMGHVSDALYEPVVRIPLLIFEPGRETGMDIVAPTSAVDLLPTLAHVTGHSLPQWSEGAILPPYADAQLDPDRVLFAVQAFHNPPLSPLKRASTTLIRMPYKLHYYFGYGELGIDELVRLYDVREDPEELTDLASTRADITADLLALMKAKLAQVDRPYQ